MEFENFGHAVRNLMDELDYTHDCPDNLEALFAGLCAIAVAIREGE